MPTPFWDDTRDYRTDGSQGGVPEEVPRRFWNEWDKMTIAGVDVPGTVVVFSRKEKKKELLDPVGQTGGVVNHLGTDPVEIDITITIWTPQHLIDYDALLRVVIPKALPQTQTGPQPATPTQASSLAVSYPSLNQLNVTSIYVHEIGSLVPGPVFGSKVSTWRAMETPPVQPYQPTQATGSIESQLRPTPARPAPTQAVGKPSQTGIGP